MKELLPEYWLRGPLPDIPALLQPVAHALLQAREEVNTLMEDFPDPLLWEKPAGLASPGFHLQHLKGVLDRLFTYAQGRQLDDEQMQYLRHEQQEPFPGCATAQLVEAFNEQVQHALHQLASTDPSTLTDVRAVGRRALPSSVIGLLTHAAEHTMRHTGQLLVTVRILKNK